MFETAVSLQTLRGIRHGFFGRTGGVSAGVFASLNCGYGTSEPAAIIAENRRRVAQAQGLDAPALLSLHQEHGPAVILIEAPWPVTMRPRGDAMVTAVRGLGLGVLTADCAPVLLADESAQIIGAAHAGWKGALGGVVEATVAAMEKLGAHRANMVAAIGPTIAQVSYEVDAAFHQRFSDALDDCAQFFTPVAANGRYHFDLPGFVYDRLERSGVGHIEGAPADTYADEIRYFSFRRATHRGEEDYGRQLAVISLV